jgi:hypothetical protein
MMPSDSFDLATVECVLQRDQTGKAVERGRKASKMTYKLNWDAKFDMRLFERN